MNKKQFATKLMASVLSASILAPCATTFGVKSQNPNSEIVSTQKKKPKAQSETQKKNIPYGQIATWGAGLAATVYGVHFLWKHFPFGRTAQGAHNEQPVAPHVDPVPRPVTPPAPAPAPVAPVAPVAAPVEDRSGWNELHHAAEGDQARLANLLDMSIEDKRRYFGERDALGRTPLYIAFKYNQSFFLDHFSNENNFRQLYPQSSQEMSNFFIFDVLCTAARLNDVHTLSHLEEDIRSTFAYRKASTDPRDYSLLNMALAQGAQTAHERFLNIGTTELGGYSLLDIALRHNARNAATYLMGQGVVCEMNNIFDDATLAPENKLEILNFLAEHGRRFANDDDRRNFIDLIFTDPVLSEDNKRVILRSLKDHGFDFKINGERRPTISNACIQLFAAAAKNYGTLINFYIENCNALSYMDGSDRSRIQRVLANKQELLTYFNQKCEDQPYVPNAQPAEPASTDTGHGRNDGEVVHEGGNATTSNPAGAPQQSTSPAQPQLTQEQIRELRLAALNRRA